ncbi:ABC-F family ATP-binding cassette domain-containing protein [Hylemonella sp. W303a]|uniref:ABC-F family ATP-binding cassette domain-containing protein n=1 Tax=Hylemonella sp. W303a TaxID=3389873 RepID=UPI00396B2925
MRAEQLALQQASYAKQQEKIAHLQKFIDRFKAKASKAKQAQSRVKALERMEKIGPVLAEADFTFEFKEPANLPNPMLTLQGVSCGYPGAEAADAPITIVRNVGKSVLAGQRIGILGANGQGKSTLVKTIAGDLQPIAGEIVQGKGLSIGYFAQQELDVLQLDDTPLDHMIRLARDTTQAGRLSGQSTREQDLRSYLGGFNFTGDQVKQAVGSMSGGEKARLVLALLVWQRPNLLLLDEPTNHLDLATREALSVALNEFEGALMLVSHDRALLRAVCDEFWLVTRGGVLPFDGDLDDYQRYLLEEAKRQREAIKAGALNPPGATATAPAPSNAAAAPQAVMATVAAKPAARENNRTRQMRKELEQCEARMAALGEEKQVIETRLGANPPLEEIQTLSARMAALQGELDQVEARWLELGNALETIS